MTNDWNSLRCAKDLTLANARRKSYDTDLEYPKEVLKIKVKRNVEDLLNRNWVRKSNSNYSSLCVCVRKRDDLRLCIDYLGLNRRTFVDRHPLPRVQETLDNLGGITSWFSTPDQGKAYHQGTMSGLHVTSSKFYIQNYELYEVACYLVTF